MFPDVSLGAVVLAGGGAARMDGIDKASIELAGKTLLEHALTALSEIEEVVVVGEEVATSRPVTFTLEDPAGGGPAAGLLAGLSAFIKPPTLLVVVAVDMPRITPTTIRRLMLDAGRDGALLIDDHGKRQYLCAVYKVTRLLESAPEPEHRPGLSMKALVAPLKLAKVPAVADEARDIDTWRDLRELS